MSDQIWNTQRIVNLLKDEFDTRWRQEIIQAKNKFSTDKIIMYHSLFGKTGPYLVISGVYIPRAKTESFDPSNCAIDGINIGDNRSVNSLSAANRENFLADAYRQLKNYLITHGYQTIFDHANDKPDESEFICK